MRQIAKDASCASALRQVCAGQWRFAATLRAHPYSVASHHFVVPAKAGPRASDGTVALGSRFRGNDDQKDVPRSRLNGTSSRKLHRMTSARHARKIAVSPASRGQLREVADETIAEVLATTDDVQTTADALVERALSNGGRDNVSVAVGEVRHSS